MAQRILFATDGSADATAAGTLLANLPLQPGATIVAVTVVPEPPALPGLPAEQVTALFAETRAAADVSVERLLADTRRTMAQLDATVEPLVRQGHPSSEIVEAADELAADWLVVGARGRSSIPGFTLGSVSQEV